MGERLIVNQRERGSIPRLAAIIVGWVVMVTPWAHIPLFRVRIPVPQPGGEWVDNLTVKLITSLVRRLL